jgi:hypothetical protein
MGTLPHIKGWMQNGRGQVYSDLCFAQIEVVDLEDDLAFEGFEGFHVVTWLQSDRPNSGHASAIVSAAFCHSPSNTGLVITPTPQSDRKMSVADMKAWLTRLGFQEEIPGRMVKRFRR